MSHVAFCAVQAPSSRWFLNPLKAVGYRESSGFGNSRFLRTALPRPAGKLAGGRLTILPNKAPLQLPFSCCAKHLTSLSVSEEYPSTSLGGKNDECHAMEGVEADGERQAFVVSPEQSGQRMDRVLAAAFPGQSRSYFQVLIDEGLVRVNDQEMVVKKRKAISGDMVEVNFVTPQRELPLAAENIPLEILYEDSEMVIINKAAGMVVHPAPGNWTGTMVHALAWRYSEVLSLGGPRPGVVHRLDKGTSGVIVAARTEKAHRLMTSLFAARDIEKTYLAISVGNPAGTGCSSCVLDAPLGRSPVDRARMAVVEPEAGGKLARSTVEVIGRDERGLLHFVQVGLETGRTHQIRVHMRHARAPILGDDVYGAFDINKKFKTSASRPMLHAARVKFRHPITGVDIDVRAPIPDDMRSLLDRQIMPGQLEARFPDW